MMPSIALLGDWMPAGGLLLFKSAIILVAASLASRAITHNARLRALLWRSTYAMLALLPLLQFVLPERQLNWFDLQHTGLAAPIGAGGRGLPFAAVVMLVWLAGVCWQLQMLLRDWYAARCVVTRSVPLDNVRIQALFAELPALVGWRAVALRTSDEVESPALFGWRNPTIVLPASVGLWTDNELRAMLLHELEHARRFDWSMMIAERLVGILYWPNVLFVFARRSAGEAREQLADRAVLQAAITPATYATQLLQLARRNAVAPASALTLALARESVEVRVKALFVDECGWQGRTRASAVLIGMCLALLPALAALRPWTCVPVVARTLTIPC